MAVHQRTTKSGERRWAVRWREGGREREKWFERQRDAKAFEAEVRIARRRRMPVLDDRITLRQLADLYESSHVSTLAPRSQDRERAQLNCRIRPDLGGYRAAELDTLAISDYLRSLTAAGVGAATVNATRATLSGIYSQAIKWKILADNPVSDTPKQQEVARLPRALTIDEVFQLANSMRHLRDRTLVIVSCLAGPRLSEAFALHWHDVQHDHLRIEHTLDEDRSLRPPKTYERRTIPLFDLARDALAELREHRVPGIDLVFHTTAGTAIHESNWNRRDWTPGVQASGIHGVKPGDMRDTFASNMIAEGCTVPWLQRKMGHARPSITLDTYGQWFADRDDGMFDRMNARINALAPRP